MSYCYLISEGGCLNRGHALTLCQNKRSFKNICHLLSIPKTIFCGCWHQQNLTLLATTCQCLDETCSLPQVICKENPCKPGKLGQFLIDGLQVPCDELATSMITLPWPIICPYGLPLLYMCRLSCPVVCGKSSGTVMWGLKKYFVLPTLSGLTTELARHLQVTKVARHHK